MRFSIALAGAALLLIGRGASAAEPAPVANLRAALAPGGQRSPATTAHLREIERLARTLPARRREALAAGLRLTRARPSVPSGKNAAPVYRRLGARLKKCPLTKAQGELLGQASLAIHQPARAAELTKLLQARTDVLEVARSAAGFPDCDLGLNFELGTELEFPDFPTMRSAVRLLGAEGVLLAKQGRYRDAARNLSLAFRVARHAESEQMFIAHLVGLACRAITHRAAAAVLELSGRDPKALRLVREVLQREPPLTDPTRYLNGEMDLVLATWRRARPQGPRMLERVLELEPGLGPVDPRVYQRLLDAWEADTLMAYTRAAHIGKLRLPQRREAFRRLDGALKRGSTHPAHMVRELFLTAFEEVHARELRRLAERRIHLTACRLLELRSAQGRFPAALERTGENWRDPFTGAPLGYRSTPDGFLLFSVGKTGSYGGGTPATAVEDRRKGEVVFRYGSGG